MREWISLLVLPFIILEVYKVPRFYTLSGADPFIYVGYTFSMSDLITRFGYPYYAVRFGLILPSNLFAKLFGAIPGYYALRWMVTVIAAAIIYHVVKRLYRWELGSLAAVMLLLSPMYIRAVMTVYSTVVGVPMVAAGSAILLMPGGRRRVLAYRLVAGLMFGLALNSNAFSLLPIAAMLLAWTYCRSSVGRKAAIVELGLVTGAAAVVTLIGAVIYGLAFGDANIIAPSLNAAQRLSSGVSPDKEIGYRWLDFEPETWLPLIASALMFGALRSLRRPSEWFERAACAMPLAMWIAYALHEFPLGSNTLEIYFYMSYMLGPTIVTIVIALALFSERWEHSKLMVGLLALGTVVAGPFAWKQFASHLSVWSLNGVIPIVLVGVLIVSGTFKWRQTIPLLVVFACLLPLVLSIGRPRDVSLAENQVHRQDPKYYQVYDNDLSDSTTDLYALAADFALAIPRDARDPGDVVFWIPFDDQLTTLLQWTYLGPYSNLDTSNSIRLPGLDDNETRHLVDRTPRFLIVMSSVESDVPKAETTLDGLALPMVSIRHFHIKRGLYEIWATVNEFVPASCDQDHQGEPLSWSALPTCPQM